MEPERSPLVKVFDTPFLSLDGTSVEMASLVVLFLVVLLVAGLRRRRQAVRRVVQGASVFVFFYVVYSCLGVFGMIRNSLHGLTLIGSVYTESFYWMALPLVAAATCAIAGPVFCGWVCPTGTLQDVAGLLRRLFKRLQARATRPRLVALGVICALFLAALVGVSVEKKLFLEDTSLHWAAGLLALCYLVTIGVVDDQPIRGLRLVSVLTILFAAVFRQIITSPTHFAFTSRADPASALATVVIAVASLLVSRAWCRYLCPWGYLMGLINRFSRVKILRDDAACDGCNVCTRRCPVGAVQTGLVAADRCQACYECIDACPTHALSMEDVWQRAVSSSPPQPSAPGKV